MSARLDQACEEGEARSWVKWTGALSLIHVEDFVDALLFVANAPQEVFERSLRHHTYLTAGETLSLGEIVRLMRKRHHRPAPMIPGTPLRKLAELFLPILPFTVKAALFPIWTVNDQPWRALGWRPHHTFRDWLAE